MSIQFYNNKILFGDSDGTNTDKIAFDADCCCQETCPCPLCENSTAPCSMTVTLPSFSDGTCGDCDELAGDYVLEWDLTPGYPEYPCRWKYAFTSGPCNATALYVGLIEHVAGQYALYVELIKSVGGPIAWRTIYTGQPDCHAINTSASYYTASFDSECSWGSTTVEVVSGG